MRTEGLRVSDNVIDLRGAGDRAALAQLGEMLTVVGGSTRTVQIVARPLEKNSLLFWKEPVQYIDVYGTNLTERNRTVITNTLGANIDLESQLGPNASRRKTVVRFFHVGEKDNLKMGQQVLDVAKAKDFDPSELQGSVYFPPGELKQGGLLPNPPDEKPWRSASVASEKHWKRG